jgi:hypothetical protein
MQNFSFNEQDIADQLSRGAGIIETKKAVTVWFYPHATRDDVASQRAGRTIFVDVHYMTVKGKNDVDFMSRLVSPEDVGNYPKEWAEYQARLADTRTSVRSLPKMRPSILKTLEIYGIQTIEDLAVADVVPELLEYKALAIRWLDVAKGVETVAKNKGGRPKGSKNKVTHAEVSEAAA